MIGVDTNVIVRLLVADDPEQAAAAKRLFESFSPVAPGWISQVVLVETFWVLRRGYRLQTDAILGAIRALISADDVVAEQRDVVLAALDDAANGADFADALIARGAQRAGARTTMTFDPDAADALGGMELLTS